MKNTASFNEEHRFIIAEQLREIGAVPQALLLEPVGRNTAPAACVAALALSESDPDPLMLVMPSDHAIGDVAAFLAAVDRAANAACAGALVTFGITPDRAETGYGYIRLGGAAEIDGVFKVAEFVEKPGPELATEYLASGGFAWNSGIFLFPARLYIDELERLRPDMVAACRRALAGARRDSDFIRLDKEAFAACDSDSIDYAVMEKTRCAAVVPVAMGWSDVGSWDALWEMSEKDSDGNSLTGDIIAEGTRNCYLRSEAGLVAAIGVEDLVVVATADASSLSRPPTRSWWRRASGPRKSRDWWRVSSKIVATKPMRCRPSIARGAASPRCTTGIGCRSSTSWSSPAAGYHCRCTITARNIGSSSKGRPRSAAAAKRWC